MRRKTTKKPAAKTAAAPGLCLMWANCPSGHLCARCGKGFESEYGPCVALRVPEWTAACVCDDCAAKDNQGTALLAVRDRFNASWAADTRPTDDIGRPLHAGAEREMPAITGPGDRMNEAGITAALGKAIEQARAGYEAAVAEYKADECPMGGVSVGKATIVQACRASLEKLTALQRALAAMLDLCAAYLPEDEEERTAARATVADHATDTELQALAEAPF